MSALYTIKTPAGQLVRSCCREDRYDMLLDYICSQIDHGALLDKPEWHGPMFCWRYWRRLRKVGYSCVQVVVENVSYGNWSIPELTEVA